MTNKTAIKQTIEHGTTPIPLGIKSTAPFRRQPARERLNALASDSLGAVVMISG